MESTWRTFHITQCSWLHLGLLLNVIAEDQVVDMLSFKDAVSTADATAADWTTVSKCYWM